VREDLDETNNSGSWEERGRRRSCKGWLCGGRPGGRQQRRRRHTPAALAEAPLSGAEVGSTVTVTRIDGGQAFRGRMMAMGIRPGVSLSVLSGGARRPLLVALPGSRFVLDWRSSQAITVRRRGPQQAEGREPT